MKARFPLVGREQNQTKHPPKGNIKNIHFALLSPSLPASLPTLASPAGGGGEASANSTAFFTVALASARHFSKSSSLILFAGAVTSSKITIGSASARAQRFSSLRPRSCSGSAGEWPVKR